MIHVLLGGPAIIKRWTVSLFVLIVLLIVQLTGVFVALARHGCSSRGAREALRKREFIEESRRCPENYRNSGQSARFDSYKSVPIIMR